MKIRGGFVSNSSSSSFMVIGWRSLFPVEIDEETGEYIINDVRISIDNELTYLYNQKIFGIALPSSCDYSVEEVGLVDFAKKFALAKEVGKKIGVNTNPSLIYGIYDS